MKANGQKSDLAGALRGVGWADEADCTLVDDVHAVRVFSLLVHRPLFRRPQPARLQLEVGLLF